MLTFPNDLEIAQAASIQHIKIIASRLGIDEDDLEVYFSIQMERLERLRLSSPSMG